MTAPSTPLTFTTVQNLVTEVLETLPREVAADLSDVEFLVCESRAVAIARLNGLMEGDPIADDDEQFPLNAKGAFVGEAAEFTDSEESEEMEHVSLASGYVVLIVDQLYSEDETRVLILHELGHALGMDDDEVAGLGLGIEENPSQQVTNAIPSAPPPTNQAPVA